METAPLATPEEELAYLRAEVARKEAELRSAHASSEAPAGAERARVVSERILEHARTPAKRLLSPRYQMAEGDVATSAARLRATFELGSDDAAIAELAATMEKRGIKNALSVAERLGNPRMMDDFHRFLVRYLAEGLPMQGASEREPRFVALHMTLYEVALPEPAGEAEPEKPLKELLSAMEQLYAGLLSVERAATGEPHSFALELAVPAERPELVFYVAVPNAAAERFEQQLLAIFPRAQIARVPSDYNIFVEGLPGQGLPGQGGASVAAEARLAANPALPLKDYTDFDYDPLHALVGAFAKIEHVGEGAALQIVVEPRGDRHVKHYQKILHALRKGEKRAAALATPETIAGELARDFGRTLFSSKPADQEKAREAETRQIEDNKSTIAQVEKKIATPIVGATIRLVASAKDPAEAARTLSDLEAAFHQFADTQGNRLEFVRASGRRAAELFERFSFRLPAPSALPLSLRELTTLYHFPPKGVEASPHLKQARFTAAPAPLTLPETGLFLGTNTFQGRETKVYLESADRARHFYLIGQTGTGKTSFMKEQIAQDIRAGEGCCFIDPHGSDILDILALVPPERFDDVIYFDPADLARPFGLNMLEYDRAHPEQKTFIVNEMLMIFRRLYGDVPESMGPAFEQYFRNATQLVMEDPSSGSTLLDIPRVLANSAFRAAKLAKSGNPIVNQFWTEIATKAEGEASLQNIVPWITNKFDDFIANDFIRPIIGQQESSFTFRDVLDRKKILLVNLSKGRLGEKNANLLGLIVVGKLFMAALARADDPRAAYPPFYLYIDEFQNITTDSIPGILSEARKYRLALTMAHQFVAQISEKTRDAVFGNVGSMAVFRVGEEDAEFFAKQFAPVFKALDFVNIENFNCYLKILARGVPQKPFNLRIPPPLPGNPAQVADLALRSARTYGRERALVESAIRARYFA